MDIENEAWLRSLKTGVEAKLFVNHFTNLTTKFDGDERRAIMVN
jgi:hypothetical protein